MLPPKRIRGLRAAYYILTVMFIVWLGTEGNLIFVTVMAWAAAALGSATLMARCLGGRIATAAAWLAACFGLGAATGMAATACALGLLALKTGLHDHGPEFTVAEVRWVWEQLPVWAIAGAIAGLAIGLLVLGRGRPPTSRK